LKTVLKIGLGITLGGLILIGGCVALLGAGADKASKEIDKAQNRQAITLKQFRSIKTGTSKGTILKRYGKPTDKQESDTTGKDFDSSCIYYNRKNGSVGDSFQLCFNGNNQLDSKNSY